MIVCEHSEVKSIENGWSIEIPEKIKGVIGIFPGQTLFASVDADFGRLLLSPLKLTPTTNYFRMFLDDVRGSLAQVTKLYADREINILSGGAFGFGNIWVSEILADFSTTEISPDEIILELTGMGGFITNREITELFPRSFDLNKMFIVKEKNDKTFIVSKDPSEKAITRTKYAIIKAWPRLRAIFVDFFPPEIKLVNIQAKIKDVPGSLYKLTEVIGSQINLNAVDELHHDEGSGLWNAYGELVVGTLKQLNEKASELDCVVTFKAEALGWI